MLFRDANGRLIIISRKKYRNETEYNKAIFTAWSQQIGTELANYESFLLSTSTSTSTASTVTTAS